MFEDNYHDLIKNFGLRNIEVELYNTFEEVIDKILEMIPIDKSIGVGNSITLKHMNISTVLNDRGNIVFDKTFANNKEESKKLKRQSLLTDWYITGSNAISKEGHIVNIDHSGNRVAAMIYGPEHVIIIVGVNKIEDTLDKAISRAKNVAAPLNAIRAGYNPPCIKLNRCIDCNSREKVCNSIVILQGQEDKDRIKLFIVNEEVGF